jgi:hypothetical protein
MPHAWCGALAAALAAEGDADDAEDTAAAAAADDDDDGAVVVEDGETSPPGPPSSSGSGTEERERIFAPLQATGCQIGPPPRPVSVAAIKQKAAYTGPPRGSGGLTPFVIQ